MNNQDIPVKCTRCRHQSMESAWLDVPINSSDSSGNCTQKVCPKCGCKSYYDMRPQVAWCWATGLIEVGDQMPESKPDGSGAIEIARGPKYALMQALSGKVRLSYAGQLLVPGVPEAETDEESVDALVKWLDWCATKFNSKKHSHGVVFSKGTKP